MRIYLSALLAILIVLTVSPISQCVLASFQDDYSAAYKSFESAKTNAEKNAAADRFVALSKRPDAGSLKGNTLYWAAECWYSMREYEKALSGFERVLLHPGSNKEEDSRFKVAYCYVRLGWKEAARWELQRFLADFPGSRHANRVKKALDEL